MRKVILLLLAVIICMILASCSDDTSTDVGSNSTNTDTKPQETETAAETEVETEAGFYKADGEFIDLETPYVTLKFPVSWDGVVQTEVFETEAGCTVKFYAYLDYRSVPLYDFVIGESDGGVLLGSLPTEKGSRSVWLIDHTENADSGLSEAAKNTYKQMSNEVNVIISNLIYVNGMTY